MKSRSVDIPWLLLAALLLPSISARAQILGLTNLTSDLEVTALGSDLGGAGDQAAFTYASRTGDFDLRVRVQSLARSDVWAKAGLMARATLAGNSAFAASLATPNLAGCGFESRATTGGYAISTGAYPVNYPNTWLRLQRTGNLFNGYASLDGANWVSLGSTILPVTNTVLVGVVVTSHNTNQPTTAQFRQFGEATGGQASPSAVPPESLGPSSRRTGLAISEIMYKPAARADGRNLEFIELFNANPFFEDLSGYAIDGDIQFTFPSGTVLPGGGFLVVAKAPADLQAVYGITNVVGPYAGNLPHTGLVQLRSRRGAVYLEVPYSNKPPWPVGADGTGHSLVLARPSYGEADPRAWAVCTVSGGSPGAVDPAPAGPLRAVVINEFLAHWHQGVAGFIELYNHSNQSVDLSGCWLSDDPATNKFQIPPGTSIGPRGFAVFPRNSLNFGLSAKGLTVYFLDPTGTGILDTERFEPETENVSIGRFPDGAADFYPLANPSPGTGNGTLLIRPVVINEIMYAPISGEADDEYIELYNQGASAVNLGGWQFVSGVAFTFPTNTMLPANGYLVVARNVTNLIARYPNLNPTNAVGDFQGTLSGKGERLALAMPESLTSTDKNNNPVTNLAYVVMDEVTYGAGGRWGQWAHGGGSSLELIDPRANHRLAANWTDSDETRKSDWVTIQYTGKLDNGAGAADSLQVIMLGGGECLVDDVAVINNLGSNVVANGGFEGGLTNWFAQGDEVRSSLETNLG
ncbi:MAG: lamin tail domain-containing protein, partial [Verrucomicrobia bacterium]|nr:lamin tail domain-containing protein [Verrucomicrobiota bacterium]